ncbi:MAG: hypothetical protein KKH04_05885 [Proteobacteria bacterium]|nr:hypothetical protein [Pseudomonadota bacterium]
MNIGMKKGLKWIFILSVLSLSSFPALLFCEDIDVSIKGIDDGIKTTKQKDYLEAMMNAKLQAIERAGVEISSITKVENFELKYDKVESKAKAVLLPGFQIMDIGYQADGTYLVILVGKVRTQEDLKKSLNALETLKKLEARTRVGVNYRTYMDTLGSVKFEVDKFLEDEEAKSNPELATLVKRIMRHYEYAGSCWRQKTQSRSGIAHGLIGKHEITPDKPNDSEDTKRYNRLRNRWQEIENRQVDEILRLYPETNKPREEGGAIVNPRLPSLDLGAVVRIVWAKASYEMQGLKEMIEKTKK